MFDRVQDGYVARIVQSPGGEAQARFPDSQVDHLRRVQLPPAKSASLLNAGAEGQSSSLGSARKLGGELFSAVFSGETRDVLYAAIRTLRPKGIRLRICLRLANVPELAGIPWELLFDPERRRFLALSNETSISRYPELPAKIRPLSVRPPFRVLVVISHPSDWQSLAVEREWKGIQLALSPLVKNGLLKLDLLPKATLQELESQLSRASYHVLHFIGHAVYSREHQEGKLILCNEYGSSISVGATQLSQMLLNHPTMRLAVVNACEGAKSSCSDYFSGTAQSLMLQRLPSAIAMQSEVGDRAAVRFAQRFYESLARWETLDAAVLEGRKAMSALQESGCQWATPVLYSRSFSGRIFDKPPPILTPLRLAVAVAMIAALSLVFSIWLMRPDDAIHLFLDDFKPTSRAIQKADRPLRVGEVIRAKLLTIGPSTDPPVYLTSQDCQRSTQRRTLRKRRIRKISARIIDVEPTTLSAQIFDQDCRLLPSRLEVSAASGRPGAQHLFAAQDEFVLALLTRLGVSVPAEALESMRRSPTADERAFELNEEGVSLVLSGDDRGAKEAFLEAIEADQDYAAAYSNLADLDSRNGDYQRALFHARTAVEKMPGEAIYRYNLGALCRLLGRPQGAYEHLNAALERDSGFDLAYNELGNVLLEMSRPDDALTQIDQGIRVNSDYAPLHKNRARSLIALGRPDDAIESLKEALGRYRECPLGLTEGCLAERAEALYLLAEANSLVGMQEESCRCLTQFLAMDELAIHYDREKARSLSQSQKCGLDF